MSEELKKVKFNSQKTESDLDSAIANFVQHYGKSFAILYSPKECILAQTNAQNNLEYVDKNRKLSTVESKYIFEARVFNEKAEMRWFNDSGQGICVILSETETNEAFSDEVCLINPQQYLFWGEISPNNNQTNSNWTELAEARIGKFSVPIKTTSRARFMAIEYLKEFEDGNVAVFEERLTGISEVK